MNLLRKEFAPVSEAAWQEINKQAKDTLEANLSARKFVDVTGPMGIELASVSLGRLNVPDKQKGAVRYGVNMVLPLVEARTSFSLNLWELDNIERGAKDINLDALTDAAKNIAAFEESAVYNGFKDAYIAGLNHIKMPKLEMALEKDSFTDAITMALAMLRRDGVDGPANLVADQDVFKFLAHIVPGGTMADAVKAQTGGAIIYSPNVTGAMLVSARGGDAELTVGQDLAIGYHSHDSEKVNLFITESFTFRVINTEAFIGFTVK